MANTYKGDLGTLTRTPISKTSSIAKTGGSSDFSSDIYKFKVGSSSNINLALTNMGNGNFADLYLYRDNDGNGSFDSTKDQLINSSKYYGTAHDEVINTRLQPGTYFARVVSEKNNYNASGNVGYNLSLSSTSPTEPNNLLAKEFVVGTLSRDISYYGYNSYETKYHSLNDITGNGNTSDTFFFSLGANAKVDITLSGLINDADIRLIQDRNKNGIVDPIEVIKSSATRGVSSEKILGINQQGDYFLQVNHYNNYSTDYTLTFDYT